MDPIRLLIVDDNQEARFLLGEFFTKQDGIEVVAQAANGLEALSHITHSSIDVMIMDIVMPQMDGFTVLQEMQKMKNVKIPYTIVTTALSRDDFIHRAVSLGAKYYIVKPFDASTLLQRVLEARGNDDSGEYTLLQAQNGQSLDERLSGLFLTIGIPAHIKGYNFLREAVKMVVEKRDTINRITKDLYPGIATIYHTSSSKVERAIRHAIEVAWSRGRVEMLNKAFGCKVVTREDKPTNGEFIAMIADKILCEKTY
ncbi:MAG: sporulation transcription factor Spo0A [Eubacteriales bacterium]|nr:sporulation transcription factor Spo0A [Eubacteriales bacterium]MDD3881518.1 sporulation transcription factor Spo0A [Eubacteriales bacterium]MDD4513000.1 sporulation transcription factor Spo0A [Eubacteriales bacterium]